MKPAWMKRSALLAVAAVTVTAAFARRQDVQIERAVNSPTLTVHFTKLKAAMITVRVNGKVASTKTVEGGALEGEVNFSLDLDSMLEGENQVEVFVYDSVGTLLLTKKSSLHVDGDRNPVAYLKGLKAGDKVRGAVELTLGVNKDLKDMYVSFFVDEQWKALKNFPPYSYIWDTTGIENGWHEVQAWVVDESNNTYKTRKIKVYVNNPGGRTDRVPAVSTPKVSTPTVSNPSTATALKGAAATKSITSLPSRPPVPGALSATTIVAIAQGKQSGLKFNKTQSLPSVQSGQKTMLPTGKRLAPSAKVSTPAVKTGATPQVKKIAVTPKAPVATKVSKTPKVAIPVQQVSGAVTKLTLGANTRLPMTGSYSIFMSGQMVKFDVQPWIEQGIALTPFRHLYEKAGGKVKWDHAHKQVNAFLPGKDVQLTIGNTKALLNGKAVDMGNKAFLRRNRTIVPLTFVARALDVKVEVDTKTKHVLIEKQK